VALNPEVMSGFHMLNSFRPKTKGKKKRN